MFMSWLIALWNRILFPIILLGALVLLMVKLVQMLWPLVKASVKAVVWVFPALLTIVLVVDNVWYILLTPILVLYYILLMKASKWLEDRF